ncbi:MAG TPA: TolC family protein [Gemmatimonadales bacterium]|nr:TolC family protein [Gemmatimonadales bacterium]
MAGHRVIASACVALGITAPLFAQAAEPADTLLARLTTEALTTNPGLAGLGARVSAAASRIRPAGALPDPALSLTLMDLTLPHFRLRESDFTELDLEARQEFPWPGTLGARSRAAAAVAQERRADLATRRREIVLQTATLYYRLRYVIAAREILRRQHALLDGSVEIATARYASGSVPQSDPLAARTGRARLGSEEAALAALESSLRVQLRALRGRSEPELLPIPPLRPEEVLALYPTLAAHPHGGVESLEQHPRLAARRAAIASAEATARAETLGARPDFQLMARYGARPIATDFFSAGVGLQLPLWAGRKQRQLAEAARQDIEAERAALMEQRTLLAAEFEATLAEAAAGLERLRLLLTEVMPSAEAGREAALRSYRVGQSDFQSVLAAQETVYRAQLEAAEVAAEHLSHLVMLEQLTRGEEIP